MIEDRVEANWSTVTDAIRLRMQQLGLSQAQIIVRSQVSKAIVGELVNGSHVRRRSPRTLAALSEALEWHPDHLECLTQGKVPPSPGEPRESSLVVADPWREVIERLDGIAQQLTAIEATFGHPTAKRAGGGRGGCVRPS